jgi:methyltransferase (TIGR00027 family)
VFEVDHPATQAWKHGRLKETGIAIPDSVTFAAIDFEKQTLAGGLRQAGFRAEESAFFSMLGVIPYLTRDAAIDTLKVVASSRPGPRLSSTTRFLQPRLASPTAPGTTRRRGWSRREASLG